METLKINYNALNGKALYSEMKFLNEQVLKYFSCLGLLGSFDDHQKTFEAYDSYPSELKNKIFQDFKTYADTLSSSIDSIETEYNDQKVLWNVLKKLGVNFDDDLFETIGPEDIVEIYRNDNIQIYRNFRFHELCDYKLPDLFTTPWDKLFFREPYFTQQIMAASAHAFGTTEKNKIPLKHIQEHELKELKSMTGSTWSMNLKYVFPLFVAGVKLPKYILSVAKVKRLNKNEKLNSNSREETTH